MIEIKNLNYSINGKSILKDINLTIGDGEFAAILGPNGAGKSTLVKIILGLIRDYEGSVIIDGKPNRMWLKKNIIGYLPQGETYDADFPATAREITLMGYAGIKGLFTYFNSQDKKKADNYLQQVGMAGKEDQFIGSLSRGEFQRVLLARALIGDSRHLFLDEPEANLDQDGVVSFFKLLKEINNRGKTIIVISHDINTLTKYCSFLICLNRTLHFHDKTDLLNAEVVTKLYGDVTRIIHKKY